MFGKNPRISTLEARKRLLVATSELHRAQLIGDWRTMAEGVRGLADRARSVGTLTSSTLSLFGSLAGFMRGQRAPTGAKTSWFQKLVSGARLASTLWLAFRPRGSNAEKPPP